MTLYCRKNQATLTASERSRLVAAFLALKADGTYDQLTAQHMNAMNDAHRGPAFLPWHRYYLLRLEQELQRIDPAVTLPYWDWTIDNSGAASLWDPDFMGGNGQASDGVVTSGPFAHNTGNWTLIYDGPALRRRFGMSAPNLPTQADVSAALADPVYDVAPYNMFVTSGFRNRLEGWINGPQLHNLVHVWVGGSMGPMSSPNDPVFYLHHCFIDKLWVDWQLLHPGAGYIPVSGGPAGHNLSDSMQPWAAEGDSITPASVLDHHALGYAYDTEPECAPTLKFIDDAPTLKFRDDIPDLKFHLDDVTLKFRDDIPTLKFRDDIPTLKFRDDQPKLPFFDEPGTVKAIDDVKTPNLDRQFDRGKFQRDDPRTGFANPRDPAAPFILSTPHHSMAWARTQPAALEHALAQLEEQITTFSEAIEERLEAQRTGHLTQAESTELHQMQQEFESLVQDYQQLAAGRSS
jgi:tyrosinase